MKHHIIAVSREFGSGGRELGKRLADIFGYTYYDKEIVTEIASRSNMNENYVSDVLEKGFPVTFALHYGQTFSFNNVLNQNRNSILSLQTDLLREIAEKDNCVIVGRAASVILKEYEPFSLFVYANMAYKIKRCLSYEESSEVMSAKEMEKKIKQVDKDRADYHRMFADFNWGDKAGYNLMVNTTDMEIRMLAPVVADYIKCWMDR